MGCCKCEEHNRWPDPQEVVWNDPADGKGYCVFHAPKDHKYLKFDDETPCTSEGFNNLVFQRIALAKLADIECTLSWTIFPFDISFDGPISLPAMNFYSATFCGSVEMLAVEILGIANFSSANFTSKIYLHDVTFAEGASFSGATFHDDALIAFSHFSDLVNIDFIRGNNTSSITIQSIDRLSLSKFSFDRHTLSRLRFINCSWPDTLCFGDWEIDSPEGLLFAEDIYRAMKQRAAEEHDQRLVSRWHFREKLMRLKGLLLSANCNALIEAVEDSDLCKSTRARAWWELFRALPWRLRISLPFLYWTFSGFGERPTRGATCLFGLVLLPVFALSPLKLIETSWSLTPDSQSIAEVLLEWVRCMPFAKLDAPTPNPPTILSALRTILSYGFQLVIGLQAALFALAVRNRFRR